MVPPGLAVGMQKVSKGASKQHGGSAVTLNEQNSD